MKRLPRRAVLAFLSISFSNLAHGQAFVRTVKAPVGVEITSIAQAQELLGTLPTAGSGIFDVINFVGAGSDADFPGGVAFPGFSGNTDDFALEVTGFLQLNRSGNYVFQINSDAGFRFTVANAPATSGVILAEFPGVRAAPADTNSAVVSVPPVTVGYIDFRLFYFERTGGEEIEFSYSLDGSPQQLVGSTGDISIFQIPEPSALGLLGIGLAGLAARRRKGA